MLFIHMLYKNSKHLISINSFTNNQECNIQRDEPLVLVVVGRTCNSVFSLDHPSVLLTYSGRDVSKLKDRLQPFRNQRLRKRKSLKEWWYFRPIFILRMSLDSSKNLLRPENHVFPVENFTGFFFFYTLTFKCDFSALSRIFLTCDPSCDPSSFCLKLKILRTGGVSGLLKKSLKPWESCERRVVYRVPDSV